MLHRVHDQNIDTEDKGQAEIRLDTHIVMVIGSVRLRSEICLAVVFPLNHYQPFRSSPL